MSKRFKTNPGGSKSVTKRGQAPAAPEQPAAVANTSVVQEPVGATAPTTATTTATAGAPKMDITLNRSTKQRKGKSVVFTSPQIRGTVRFPASAFMNGKVPDTLQLGGEGFAAPGISNKLSPEERKARRAAMTPEQKAEQARKLAAQLARRAERLEKEAAAARAGQTEQVAAEAGETVNA